MTLLERLTDYYGAPDNDQEQFVAEREKHIDEESKSEIYSQLIQTRSKRYGFPDVAVLSRVLQKYTQAKETQKKHYWCVCDVCNTEYAYGFMSCPQCFIQGKDTRSYKLKVSDNPPPPNVIKYNMTHLGNDGCVNCADKPGSFCEHFGQEWYSCDRTDFDNCACKQCCITHKKQNSKLRNKG